MEIYFKTKTVPELKRFLSDRGISCREYRKHNLVRLAELADELKLEVILQQDDYKDTIKTRRTIKLNDGSTFVAPELNQVNWTENLKNLPLTEMPDLLIYFLKTGEWSNTRLKDFRQDEGYKMFKDRHINDVKMCKIEQSDYVYVVALCKRETKQSENPYSTWLILHNDGHVYSGGCSCPCDDGTCKHCTAFLFAMADFSDRHSDRSTSVGTDEVCKWDQPRKISLPCKIDDICIKHDQQDEDINPTVDTFKPSINPDTSFETVEKEIINLCKGTGAVMLDLFDQNDSNNDQNFPTMTSVAWLFNESNNESLLDILRTNFTKDVIFSIDQSTSKQNDCDDWYKQRLGRITASIAYSVCHFRDTDKDDNYILKKIMNPYSVVSSIAIEYGRDNEVVAKLLYSEDYKKSHKKAKICESGLVIDEELPFIGASPDGKVKCKCCGEGLIEIKCTYSYRNLTAEEICIQDKTYFIYLDDNNNVRLKKNTSWYYQIQMQLGICKRKWCDFIFYSKKGYVVERIEFQEDLFAQIKLKCQKFFDRYVLSALKRKILK